MVLMRLKYFIFLLIIRTFGLTSQNSSEAYYMDFNECFNLDYNAYLNQNSSNKYYIDSADKGFLIYNKWRIEIERELQDNVPRYQIVNRPGSSDNNKSLKLTLGPQDYAGGGHRIELKYYSNKSSGTYFYSWDFFIPYGTEWDEIDTLNNGNPVRSIFLAQWHNSSLTKVHDDSINYQMESGENNLPPPIVLTYKPESESDLEPDNKRGLAISYGLYRELPPNEDLLPYKRQYHLLENIIKLEEWNNIITEINWSHGQDGYMKLWMNKDPYEEPDILINGPNVHLLGNWQNKPYPISNCGYIYNNEFDMIQSNDLRCNTLKMGIYKGGITEMTNEDYDSIYLDNFTEAANKEDLFYLEGIENEFPDCSVNKPEINDYKIYPNPSSGSFTIVGLVEGDIIEFYNNIGQELKVKNRFNRYFTLTDFSQGLIFVRIQSATKSRVMRVIIK